MIKKLCVSILMVLTLLFTSSITTKAEVGDIEWYIDNPYSTYYAAVLSLEISLDTYKATIYIPESDRHLLGDGGIHSYMTLKYGGVDVYTVDIVEINGGEVFGEYVINLEALGLYAQIDEITFYIMQDWDTPPDIPTYITALETQTEVLFNYNLPYDITVEWYSQYLFSNYYGILSTVDILMGSKTMTLLIPASQFHELVYMGIEATIEFYDDADVKIHELVLNDYYDFPYIAGLHYINFEDLEDAGFSEVPTASYLDFEYFKIFIPQNYDLNIPEGYIDYLTENSSITYNDTIKRVNFISEGDVYATELFDLIPSEPIDPVRSSADVRYYFEFKGWYTADGLIYNFTPVKDEDLLNNTFYLYAKYDRLSNDTYVPDEPVANEDTRLGKIFVEWGWNVSTGYLLTYAIAVILIIIAGVGFSLPSVAIIATITILTSIWAYNGFMSIALSIVMGVILIVAFLLALKGGD